MVKTMSAAVSWLTPVFVLSGCTLNSLTVDAGEATKASDRSTPAASDPGFHLQEPVSPKLPYDVDIGALRLLSATPAKPAPPYAILPANLPYAQRLFDVFSWKVFLALNWPALPDGQPDPNKNLGDVLSPRVWESYCEVGRVFRENGADPLPWAESVKDSWAPERRTLWMHGMGIGRRDSDSKPLLDESLQAFTGPLVDQQGRWVRYQVALNRTEFDYLVENRLYNLEGQAAFTAQNKIEFPANDGANKPGAMELKFAWKQLSDQDDPERFFVRRAKVKALNGAEFEADFALVGMHIAARTASSPTWAWATFEHVNNTAANDLEKDGKGRALRPSFFNPDNPAKPVNLLAAKNSAPVRQFDPRTGHNSGMEVFTSWDESKTTDPTQMIMVLPVPKATAELNREVQAILAKLGSVFRYYELIGTQWPSDPAFPAFPSGVSAHGDGQLLPSAPESILYKIPGKVVPVNLINTTMETFFQGGNQVAGPLAEDDRLPPGQVADPSMAFATESCAGCHFSAGACLGFKRDANGRFLIEKRGESQYRIPIFGKNASRGVTGNADYSWLLQLRAQQAPYTGTNIAPLGPSLVSPPNSGSK